MDRYEYIGPQSVRERALHEPPGATIDSLVALDRWLADNPHATHEGATFVITVDGALALAPRRSEHVACARGEPVLSAGEMVFALARGRWTVRSVSNQSTGYAPEPASYGAVARALDRLGVARPESWTHEFIFRRCPACAQLALVKDSVFECAVCGAPLPLEPASR
ncbi:MAG: hypothetical protein U0269_22640 [Polyangiales bacterium]